MKRNNKEMMTTNLEHQHWHVERSCPSWEDGAHNWLGIGDQLLQSEIETWLVRHQQPCQTWICHQLLQTCWYYMSEKGGCGGVLKVRMGEATDCCPVVIWSKWPNKSTRTRSKSARCKMRDSNWVKGTLRGGRRTLGGVKQRCRTWRAWGAKDAFALAAMLNFNLRSERNSNCMGYIHHANAMSAFGQNLWPTRIGRLTFSYKFVWSPTDSDYPWLCWLSMPRHECLLFHHHVCVSDLPW